jgi:hypothetical protein
VSSHTEGWNLTKVVFGYSFRLQFRIKKDQNILPWVQVSDGLSGYVAEQMGFKSDRCRECARSGQKRGHHNSLKFAVIQLEVGSSQE